MALTLYFDHNFSGPIITQLRERGLTIITTNDDGTSRMADRDLLDRATALGCVLVSGDADLLIEAARRQRAEIHFGGVIYCHQDHQADIGTCVDDLELIAKVQRPEELLGQVQYLPL